jgi:hypothetical protein
MVAEKTARKQRGRPFRKGLSGNPRGRPLGARNRATIAMEALLDGEAEAITRKAVEKAKEGDTTALRLCLERILPPRKDRPIALLMPKLSTVADAAALMAAITSAVAIGDVTTSEAAELAKLIDTYVRAVEATDLDKRLRAIEQAMTK